MSGFVNWIVVGRDSDVVDGTVYFYVYGGTGEDTYWATYFLWSLINGQPPYGKPPLSGDFTGVTAMILGFVYINESHYPIIIPWKFLDNFSENAQLSYTLSYPRPTTRELFPHGGPGLEQDP